MSYDKRPEVLTQVRDRRGGSASTEQDFPEAQWYFSQVKSSEWKAHLSVFVGF